MCLQNRSLQRKKQQQQQQQQYDLPHAIYLDAVDTGGLIRTGTRPLDQPGGSGQEVAGFAYVDTVVLVNVNRVCSAGGDKVFDQSCQQLKTLLAGRRAKHPLATWSDPSHGRLVGWPNF
mmetsp:Transcript_14550/g.28494  ORF Transcript_14550/g.28494 Transcript_14550/m.28494 type:complete len:119 (-) Transcript_14550:273-629(-)